MGLDYTDGCVNFRDVGLFLNWITEKQAFPENKLFRGGTTDYVKDIEELRKPASIINLRKSHDLHTFDADYYHFPISNKFEKYHTEQKEVREWLNAIVRLFASEELKYPVFIHCLSGKDRTGIVVAALLLIAEIPEAIIVSEYLLSEGEVKEEWIRTTIDGIQGNPQYFNTIDLEVFRRRLLADH